MRQGNQGNGGTGARQTAKVMTSLLVTLAMALSFLLPLGAQAALAEEALEPADDVVLAEEEGVGLVAAEAAPLVTETIKLKTPVDVESHGCTFKGTKFQAVCQGDCDEFGAQIVQGENLVISSLDGTAIKNVDLHFSFYEAYDDDGVPVHINTMSVNAGSLSAVTITDAEEDEAVATISNVNATSVTLSTTHVKVTTFGPMIDEITVYYEPKAENPVQASAVKATQTLTFKTAAQTLKAADVFKVTGAKGAVTYSKKSGDAGITVGSDGKVTVKKGQAVGNYKVVFSVKAAGDATYEAATKDVAVTFAVNKAKNPITATAVAKKAKASKVAKKAVTVKRPMKVSNAQGKLQFAKVKSGSSKYLTVNKNTGKVTVKKGTKKGTYKIKIKVTAKGTSNYKAGSKTVKCTVKVV